LAYGRRETRNFVNHWYSQLLAVRLATGTGLIYLRFQRQAELHAINNRLATDHDTNNRLQRKHTTQDNTLTPHQLEARNLKKHALKMDVSHHTHI
jgi:hypothetical protein